MAKPAFGSVELATEVPIGKRKWRVWGGPFGSDNEKGLVPGTPTHRHPRDIEMFQYRMAVSVPLANPEMLRNLPFSPLLVNRRSVKCET